MKTFDLRDTIIPFSFLQIAHAFRRMKCGEEIEICGNDAGIARDLKNILPGSELTIHTVETIVQERPRYRWRLRKKTPIPSDTKETRHV